MAEQSSGDKTEEATPKKRQDARKEGNVPQSKEITIAVTLIVSFYVFKLLYPWMCSYVMSVITETMERIPKINVLNESDAQSLFLDYLIKFGIASLPVLLAVGLVAIIASMAQTKMLVNFKSLKPKFNRMNPLEGIKRLFSLKGFIEVLKSVLKIVILIYIIYICIKNKLEYVPKLIDSPIETSAGFTGNLIFDIVEKVIIAFVVIAVADFFYQRYQYSKNLKMTKQEVKEEYKSTEGDPQIKGKIKQKQREISQRRMMQEVPNADVIIRNPTHFAVAVKYDAEKNAAPVVLAKGQDLVALRIVKIAEENDITIVENVPLARGLYAAVEPGQEIPREFYNPVAEVLAYVYSLKKKELS